MSTITKTCRGIYREPDHSPGRIDDDRAIMDCVGQALTVHGFSVELVEADAAFDTRCANIFAMCERGAQAIASHLAERFERRVRIVSRQGVES
jgi:hypothetical protein